MESYTFNKLRKKVKYIKAPSPEPFFLLKNELKTYWRIGFKMKTVTKNIFINNKSIKIEKNATARSIEINENAVGVKFM